jgi:hypothetical protein
MRSIKLASKLSLMGLLALGACTTPGEIRTEYIEVPMAVPTGCVAEGGKPEVTASLRDRYTAEQWAALAPGAKANAIRAQAGRRMNYEDALRAATAACQ